MTDVISAIVPTIGRPSSLRALLDSLAAQTRRPDEVIVADAGDGPAIAALVHDPRWKEAGLEVEYLRVQPPNAVRQRKAAIARSKGDLLLLLDDDVVPEPGCVAAMLQAIAVDGVVAVTADFSNQPWSGPSPAWSWYLRRVVGMNEAAWQGKVVGPLLRFGYRQSPAVVMPMEWLGAGNSLVRREAYLRAGGFSDFFLHRCTTNEDVDLGIKLNRLGRIVLNPAARMAHMHASQGRVSVAATAEDDIHNRYLVMRRTLGYPALRAYGLVTLFVAIETASNILGSLRRWRPNGVGARFGGRLKALLRILVPARARAAE